MYRQNQENANIQKVVVLKPKHPGKRQCWLGGGSSICTLAAWPWEEAGSSASKALSKQVGQELLKGWVRTLWLG